MYNLVFYKPVMYNSHIIIIFPKTLTSSFTEVAKFPLFLDYIQSYQISLLFRLHDLVRVSAWQKDGFLQVSNGRCSLPACGHNQHLQGSHTIWTSVSQSCLHHWSRLVKPDSTIEHDHHSLFSFTWLQTFKKDLRFDYNIWYQS